MRYIIIGAGAVGGTIGGRLAQAGREVVLVARGAHLTALRERGLRLVTPDGDHTHRLTAVDGPGALGELRADDVLVLAVKTQDTTAALEDWAHRPVAGGSTAGERLPLLCAQNGVENERMALRRFRRVLGVCVWLPSTYLEPGLVSAGGAPLTGILHLGTYPAGGKDPAQEAIAADLGEAHFDAPLPGDVMRWKYAKLLGNLANALEAVTGPFSDEDQLALLDAAREEGARVLTAAGLDFASEDEMRAVRGDRVEQRALPGAPRGGGSSWQSLVRGTGTIEADYLNGEIVLLGRLHGVPTPVNATLAALANDSARTGRQPGALSAREVRERIERAR
ncbi:ketopantoate reductase family protein [Streptomyces sp. NPDC007088]|uniref:ketopantoate reductase family protein n=1 Tax=Streptomyces sp. NPDC007088 TaxID=3364773 RepID=UPI0036BCA76B